MTSLPFEDLQASTPATGFAEFWIGYPKKVGKRDAERAWRNACKRKTPKEIITGRDRYIKHKPAWQDWMNPATFLNGDRCDDEYETPAKPKSDYETQSLETAAWKIRHGTGDGHQFPVTRKQARACIDAGLVTEEQARPWL